jgi:hypothetical protein
MRDAELGMNYCICTIEVLQLMYGASANPRIPEISAYLAGNNM